MCVCVYVCEKTSLHYSLLTRRASCFRPSFATVVFHVQKGMSSSGGLGAHRLVGYKQVLPLTRGVPQRNLEVQIVVVEIHPTRPREYFAHQTVMDVVGTDIVTKQSLHIFFFNEWATGASFMNTGDEITLRGFVVHDVPRTHDVAAGNIPAMPGSGAEFFIMPLEGLVSELSVVQPAEQGDWMEVIVKPSNFENPTVRCKKGKRGVTGCADTSGNNGAVFVAGNGKALPERDAP